MSIQSQVRCFVGTPTMRNLWFYEGALTMYVRQGYRFIEQQRIRTFDIANVVVESAHQHQGLFTAALSAILKEAKHAKFDCVYVENVLDNRLGIFLVRQGFLRLPGDMQPYSYYRLL